MASAQLPVDPSRERSALASAQPTVDRLREASEVASAQVSVDRLCESSAAAGAQLTVDRLRGRSVVTRAQSAAPLRLLAPASPGCAAWVYQSSLGGGFVGRDAVELAVHDLEGVSAHLRLGVGFRRRGRCHAA